MAQEINGQSMRLGETPTMIYRTPTWPYGRYTYPAGGRFIRPYEQSAPLPETLTELQKAEVESPPARAYLDSAWVAKSPELSPHKWGATTRTMTEVEKEYLAAWGRPRFTVVPKPVALEEHVGSQITHIEAPQAVGVDENFAIKVSIKTVGSGCDRQFLALFDPIIGDYIGAGASDECIPPDSTGAWTATIRPLSEWYPTAIPDTLTWIARVGYVTKVTNGFEGIMTDERQFSIPVAGAPPTPPPIPPSFLEKYKYPLIAASAVGLIGVAAGLLERRKKKWAWK